MQKMGLSEKEAIHFIFTLQAVKLRPSGRGCKASYKL